MKCLLSLLCTACMMTLALPGLSNAHEFLIKPVKFQVEVGDSVPFSVVSAHVMMISEEVEPLEYVKVTLVEGSKSKQLNMVANEFLLTADGRAVFSSPGTAILSGHREGVIWTQTTKGWKQASKKGLSGVIKSNKYEKFCKTFVRVGASGEQWKTPLGQKLEILPLADPTSLKAGDVLPVQVLFDGKPIAVENVLATYDGFSLDEMAFAGSYEPSGDGIANIHITMPGVWMIRVQHKIDSGNEDYDGHVMRSVMIFEVR